MCPRSAFMTCQGASLFWIPEKVYSKCHNRKFGTKSICENLRVEDQDVKRHGLRPRVCKLLFKGPDSKFFFFLSFGGQGAKIRILCIYLHSHLKYKHLKMRKPDIPGNPVIRLHASTAGGLGSIPSQGTKIPHPEWHSQ